MIEVTVIDERFTVVVAQKGDGYKGDLIITDRKSGTEIAREEVGVSYGAMFGPDIGDMTDWIERSLEIVDAWKAANEK